MQWFREEVSKESESEGEFVVALIELIADAHAAPLQETESRLARWESNTRHDIGDFLYNTLLNVLPLYDQYLENLLPTLEKLEYSIRTSKHFDQLCRDFEAQKHCYLPLTSFLLKPLQRLLHYNSIIDSKNLFFVFEPSQREKTDFFENFLRIARSLPERPHRLRGLPSGQGPAGRDPARGTDDPQSSRE